VQRNAVKLYERRTTHDLKNIIINIIIIAYYATSSD